MKKIVKLLITNRQLSEKKRKMKAQERLMKKNELEPIGHEEI